MSYNINKRDYGDTGLSNSNSKETVDDILEYPIVKIEERGLSKVTCKTFGIRCAVNPDTDEVEAIYYPYYKEKGELGSGEFYLSGFKKKDLTVPKKAEKGKRSYHFTAIGEVDYDCLLFGLPQLIKKANPYRVVITEGENDCAAFWEGCAKFHKSRGEVDKIKDLVILSIGFGTATATKHISNDVNQYYLKKFDKKVLCFDNDEATLEEYQRGIRKGKEATKAVVSLYPEYKLANTKYTLNDPNDMLLAGKNEELFWAMMTPDDYISQSFIDLEKYKDQMLVLPKLGRLWPWDGMNKMTLGKRPGEGYYFGAGVGQGKSLILGKLLEQQKAVPDEPPTAFMFEESPLVSVNKIMGLSSGKKFHDPSYVIMDGNVDCFGDPIPEGAEGYFTLEDKIKAVDNFNRDNILIYNNERFPDWEKIKEDIRYATLVRGSKDIYIDPLTGFLEGLDAAEGNRLLSQICRDLYLMGNDIGFNFYVFCHLNAPTFGPPHEEGGKVKGNQFTGSKAMMRAAVGQWGLERNRSDHLPPIITNMSWMTCLKDRVFGKTGGFHLYYDSVNNSFEEPSKELLEEYEDALEQEKQRVRDEKSGFTSYSSKKDVKKVDNGPTTSYNNLEDWVDED